MQSNSDVSHGVDSYQVPVPLGDCSLHFSVVRTTGETKSEIKIAIIVDGGKNDDGMSATQKIEATVVEVTKKYTNFTGFHYWLVTHWDDDHYAGALRYLAVQKSPVEVFGPVSWKDKNLGVRSEEDQIAIETLNGNREFEPYEIGRDFFGEGCFPRQPKNTSFVQWSRSLAKDRPADTAKPMFLCVAAFGDCFNNPEKDKPIDGKVRDSDNKNATSAFFIIAWPGSPNICYYAAGDGNEEIEKYFYETNFLNAISDNERALVIKGTHHGAFNAFNADLFGHMKPRNYVVSAGRKFGHPTAALLVLFAIHKLKQHDNDKFTLYTSRYPYWLTENPMAHGKAFLNAEDIKEELEKHKLTDERLTNIWDLVKDLDDAKLGKLAGALQPVWKFLARSNPPSDIKDKTMPYRVHMRFYHVDKGSSRVKISAFASEEGDDWDKE